LTEVIKQVWESVTTDEFEDGDIFDVEIIDIINARAAAAEDVVENQIDGCIVIGEQQLRVNSWAIQWDCDPIVFVDPYDFPGTDLSPDEAVLSAAYNAAWIEHSMYLGKIILILDAQLVD
jgi:hypothetical protein